MPGRPSSAPRSGPSPTKASVPSPRRSNARARRRTFFRSVSEPSADERRPVGAPAELRARLAGVAAARSARGRRRSRPPPRRPRASGPRTRAATRSQSETATIAAARRTDVDASPRARLATGPTFSTSWPCAVSTAGAPPASAASSPAGTRKCAYTTSGRNRRAVAHDVAGEHQRDGRGRRGGRRPRARARARAPRAPARARRRTCRGPGASGPGYIWETSRMRTRRALPRVTWRMPRHISSVVPSPQST